LYGSILPVCSCGVVPLVESMQRKTSLKVIITFIVATPLLNPYIISVSFAVLGVEYGILRIVFSFLTAIITGWAVEYAAKALKLDGAGDYKACITDCDPVLDRDPFVKTLKMTRKILPYILFAGALSFAFALINPKQYLETLSFAAEPWATLILTLIGIPLYVCNGTDVLFLKPLMQYTDLSMGAAIAFSLSSSAICISSIVMLAKYLGGKLTSVLVSTIFILMLLFSTLINLIF
ncbi:MAG: permease, partial [Bacteroidia bacterium]|nr:permease [Bacteroidia bacterium]